MQFEYSHIMIVLEHHHSKQENTFFITQNFLYAWKWFIKVTKTRKL